VGQAVAGAVTTYAWDWAQAVPELLQTCNLQSAICNLYLIGHETLGWWDGAAWAYILADGLGSVRQAADGAGVVVSAREWTPYGEEVGGWRGGLGYTGEWQDADVGLVYLRARWYAPGVGRFTQPDPWEGEQRQPILPHSYLYVGGNPVGFVDPSGMWRWGATGSIYHTLIEEWYEWPLPLINPAKQLEYSIPGTPFHRPDMFNSVTGDVYEIEPWFNRASGRVQVAGYVSELLTAASAGRLLGTYFGIPYDWNATPFHIATGVDWPGKFRAPLWPNFPAVDLVADYVGDGVVIYWIEPNALALFGALPFVVPNKRLVRPPNWVPGQYALQPAYAIAWYEACGYALIVIGGVVITVTLVEDIATLGVGTFDDAITVPAGILFINWGQRLAVFVPASGP